MTVNLRKKRALFTPLIAYETSESIGRVADVPGI